MNSLNFMHIKWGRKQGTTFTFFLPQSYQEFLSYCKFSDLEIFPKMFLLILLALCLGVLVEGTPIFADGTDQSTFEILTNLAKTQFKVLPSGFEIYKII